MRHDLFDLFVADKRPVDAGDLGPARHIQHIAHAQQLFSPLLAQDRAAVDARGDLEGNPCREVGLDRAGDHIDRGALGRHDQVNARGPRHLRQALDASFNLFARHHHQVGHLVHHHHDIGQGDGGEFVGFKHGLAGVFIKPRLNGALEHLVLGQCFAHTTIVAFDVAHPHF